MLKEDGALKKGQDIIKGYQKTLPDTAGVYRMLDEHENVLYVGKAKSLKKRVVSYTHVEKLSRRIQMMVMQTHTMEFVHTNTEAEALLLEANLIKKLKPRYNILLRDDKSFPYIFLSEDHDYPVVTKHRGAHKRKGRYFGPFANASAVTRTINILQKVFMLRNCTDNVFANRSRPCLQYHIKRCTAPCVDYVSKQGYAEQVKQAQDFLDGKSESIKDIFVQQMQEASAEQDYERAAQLRDRVKALSAVQGHQDINIAKLGDADVIALSRKSGVSCIQVFFFRAGRNYGNHAYFPRHKAEDTEQDVLTSFIGQFYANKPVPPSIYVSHDVTDQSVVEDALSSLNRSSEARVKLLKPQRGDKRRIVVFAEGNASDALDLELIKRSTQQELLAKLKDVFGLDKVPERIEVYDNSHTSGTNMVGAMIVSGPEGFQKNAYRKFNIREAASADDYGMMKEVLSRRFKNTAKGGGDSSDLAWPDLVLIDGGKGQLSVVMGLLGEMGIADKVHVVAIAKGEDRNAGRENFFMPGKPSFQLPVQDPVLHFLQRLRDEAHRFAIGSHRVRRQKDAQKSPLDGIPGVGPKRKKALLHYFGSAKAVQDASIQDLQKVDGVSKAVAEVIYYYFREG